MNLGLLFSLVNGAFFIIFIQPHIEYKITSFILKRDIEKKKKEMKALFDKIEKTLESLEK